MEFRLLGPLEVVEDGKPVPLGGPRQLALLALLLLRAGETVPRDWLVDELWEERPPASGMTALHNQVARLRRSLGADRVLTQPQSYVLRVEPGERDVERFRELVAQAAELPAGERRERLDEALAMWRGEPLAGARLGAFARVEATRLEESRVAAVEELVEARLELGEHADLVPELTALVAAHPLSERLRGQLILALYRSGRQAEALDVYRETRQLLADELGLEPGPQLKELERAILRHDPELAPAPRPPRPAAAALVVAARPRGRLATFAALTALLAVAGALAGLLVARQLSPQRASADGPPATTATAGGSTTAAVTGTRPGEGPAKKHGTATTTATPVTRPRTRQRRRPVTTTAPAVAVVRTRTVTQPAATTPTRPATTAAQPKPKPKPFTIADDFSRPVLDPLIWYAFGREYGGDFVQRDGLLEITLLADAQPDPTWNQVGGHYGSQCKFPGDFDATVEYELLAWPRASGANAGLNAFFADAGVVRQSSARFGDQYSAWVAGTGSGMPLPDTRGKLRLKRVGRTITTYIWYREGWLRLVSGTSSRTATLGLSVQADADEFTREEVRVAYDNFAVKATEASCPPGADPRS